MIDRSEAFAALAEQASLVDERFFLTIGLRRLLAVELYFIVYLSFGREQFAREIERNTRLGFLPDKRLVARLAIYRILEIAGGRSRTDFGSRESNWQSVNASTDAERGESFKIDNSPKKSPSR